VTRASTARATSLALLGATATLAGCMASSPRTSAAEEARGPEVPPPPAGTVEPPYTASQIARCHPVGTFTTYRITRGGSTVEQRTEWIAADVHSCRMRATTVDSDGNALPETEGSALWWELRDHAAFPRGATTESRERIEIASGSYDCTLLTVRSGSGEARSIDRFWFDRGSAGSPVLYVQEVEGREVMCMELLATNRRSLAD
jgi:hypothetical protein